MAGEAGFGTGGSSLGCTRHGGSVAARGGRRRWPAHGRGRGTRHRHGRGGGSYSHRRLGRNLGGLDLPNLGHRQGPSRIRLNGLFASLERGRRRRRGGARNHRTCLHRNRRSGGHHGRGSQHRLLGRHDGRRERADGGARQCTLVDSHEISRHRLGSLERLRGHFGDRAGHVTVDVVDVGHVHGLIVDDRGVVDVVDDRGVHGGIRDVDVVHVAAAHRIAGHVYLAGAERKPSYTGADADPRDERGCVNRSNIDSDRGPRRSGYPAPNAADRNPSAVMKGGKSPRLVIDPGVSPGRNIGPMAVVVGGPTHFDVAGKPHGSILGYRAPCALIVEIFVPDHIGRDIARGHGVLPPSIPVRTPRIERVLAGWVRLHIFRQLIRA